MQFFAQAGFPCPDRRNPSDHLLRCVNSDFDNVKATLQGYMKLEVSISFLHVMFLSLEIVPISSYVNGAVHQLLLMIHMTVLIISHSNSYPISMFQMMILWSSLPHLKPSKFYMTLIVLHSTLIQLTKRLRCQKL